MLAQELWGYQVVLNLLEDYVQIAILNTLVVIPFGEVFDGIAIANSAYGSMDAYLKDYSDGSATVMWKAGNTDVMEATFIHGSPYVYFKVYDGSPIIKTLRSNSGEKGIFYESGDSLGVWTNVAWQ
jgi:hypothetical protein